MDKPVSKRPQLYIVNLQWTPKDDNAVLKINGKCDEVMKIVMSHLGIDIPNYERVKDPIFYHAVKLTNSELSTTTNPSLEEPSPCKDEKTEEDVKKEEDAEKLEENGDKFEEHEGKSEEHDESMKGCEELAENSNNDDGEIIEEIPKNNDNSHLPAEILQRCVFFFIRLTLGNIEVLLFL